MNRMMHGKPKRVLLAAVLVAAAGTALAQSQATDVRPLPGEARVTITMGARTTAFPTKIAPLARETIPFETNGHAVTEEGRQAMARLNESLLRQPGGSLIVVVYGENETLAFQRARAVRGELSERHSMDPARIIATGRKAEGHVGDLAVVDVYGADPTRCGGCGTATFRTIALDSGTIALATSNAEALPANATASTEQKLTPASPPAARQPVARAPVDRPPAAAQEPEKLQPPAAPTRAQAAVQTQASNAKSSGCPRPRIIIDDYYPGGPIVPCRAIR